MAAATSPSPWLLDKLKSSLSSPWPESNWEQTDVAQKDTEIRVTTVKATGKIIAKMRVNSATGPNGLPSAIYKGNLEGWSTLLTNLYNACYSLAKVPNSWRVSILCPIFKKGSRSMPSNYRLIALLDLKAKAYAQILLNHLEN